MFSYEHLNKSEPTNNYVLVPVFVHFLLDRRQNGLFRHCTISRKFSGSLSDNVIGVSSRRNPSSCTVQGPTQPLTNEFWHSSQGIQRPVVKAQCLEDTARVIYTKSLNSFRMNMRGIHLKGMRGNSNVR
jgi:hypothetical protein